MHHIVQTYRVKVIREAGNEPITNHFYQYAEEEFDVNAISRVNAYKVSQVRCTLEFRGQLRRTFIDEVEYFGEF